MMCTYTLPTVNTHPETDPVRTEPYQDLLFTLAGHDEHSI